MCARNTRVHRDIIKGDPAKHEIEQGRPRTEVSLLCYSFANAAVRWSKWKLFSSFSRTQYSCTYCQCVPGDPSHPHPVTHYNIPTPCPYHVVLPLSHYSALAMFYSSRVQSSGQSTKCALIKLRDPHPLSSSSRVYIWVSAITYNEQ